MAGNDGAYVGRDVVISFSLSQDALTIPTDFKRIGAVRSKDFGPEWETVDATADDSANQTRENLVTFKSFNPSFSGVSRTEEDKNCDELEDHVINPASGQPCGWIRIQRPSKNSTTKTYYIPVIFISYKITANYDGVVEWNMDSQSNGGATIAYL